MEMAANIQSWNWALLVGGVVIGGAGVWLFACLIGMLADTGTGRVFSFATLVFIGLCLTQINFAPVKEVDKKIIINRNEEMPDGTISAGDCKHLQGKSMARVVYRYGFPKGEPLGGPFDTMHFPLTGDEKRECHVYFEYDENVAKKFDETAHNMTVRNVSLDL